jgi:hypothetical protein
VPYGGAGSTTQVRGTDVVNGPVRLQKGGQDFKARGLADTNGGPHPYTPGDSRMVMAAFARWLPVNTAAPTVFPSTAFGAATVLTVFDGDIAIGAEDFTCSFATGPVPVSGSPITFDVQYLDSTGAVLVDDQATPFAAAGGTTGYQSSESVRVTYFGSTVAHIRATATLGAGFSNTITVSATSTFTNHVTEDPTQLWTWGYGGYGQMGSGSDLAANPEPIAVNGLGGILRAAVAPGLIFAIVTAAAAVKTGRRRSPQWC